MHAFLSVCISYWSLVSKMTYYVSSGTLNPTHSLTSYWKWFTLPEDGINAKLIAYW